MTTQLDDKKSLKLISIRVSNAWSTVWKKSWQTVEVWILTDEHGCVMLNTEDEDCVPVAAKTKRFARIVGNGWLVWQV